MCIYSEYSKIENLEEKQKEKKLQTKTRMCIYSEYSKIENLEKKFEQKNLKEKSGCAYIASIQKLKF